MLVNLSPLDWPVLSIRCPIDALRLNGTATNLNTREIPICIVATKVDSNAAGVPAIDIAYFVAQSLIQQREVELKCGSRSFCTGNSDPALVVLYNSINDSES